MVKDRAIVTMLTNRVIRGLSNGAILNDLDGPQTQILRSGHSLTLNISKMAEDTASYYRRRIGNRTQAFKWYHFQ